MDQKSYFEIGLTFVIVFILGTLVTDAIRTTGDDQYKPKENQECIGEPLFVDYPYYGGMVEEHACAQQCDDNIQYYISYTNGKATQCQILPGCVDWGEDNGVTCIPSEPESRNTRLNGTGGQASNS